MHLGVPIVQAPLSTVNNLIRRNDKSEVKYSDLNFFYCGSRGQKRAAKKAKRMQLWQMQQVGSPMHVGKIKANPARGGEQQGEAAGGGSKVYKLIIKCFMFKHRYCVNCRLMQY